VLKTVLEAQGVLSGEKIPSALIGGFALRGYGDSRLPEEIELLVPRLPRSGVRLRLAIEVNLITNDDAPELTADAIKNAKRTRWNFRLASPEHLAALKMVSGRPDDQTDLAWLLRQPTFDRAKLRRLVRKFLGERWLPDLDALYARHKPGRKRRRA
jgi:hypothetical protein